MGAFRKGMKAYFQEGDCLVGGWITKIYKENKKKFASLKCETLYYIPFTHAPFYVEVTKETKDLYTEKQKKKMCGE